MKKTMFKRFRLAFVSMLILPFIFSCSTEFDPNADWKDITVVYGLLNQNDSITYIKINKAFLGPGNALEFAKVEDSSSYFGNLDVKLVEYLGGNTTGKILYLDTTTIFNKESGLFYNPKQVIWKCVSKNQFNEDAVYKLEIRNKKTGKIITAESPVIGNFDITKPSVNATSWGFYNTAPSAIEWYSAENGKRYQLSIIFNYTEVSSGDTTRKKVTWIFPAQKSQTTVGGVLMKDSYKGEEFYRTLASSIPYKENVKRFAGKVEFVIAVAGEELNNYIDVTAPSGGIVQERPEYSNINNGIGIFSCRYDNSIKQKRIVELNSRSLDTLIYGQFTKDLGFK